MYTTYHVAGAVLGGASPPGERQSGAHKRQVASVSVSNRRGGGPGRGAGGATARGLRLGGGGGQRHKVTVERVLPGL